MTGYQDPVVTNVNDIRSSSIDSEVDYQANQAYIAELFCPFETYAEGIDPTHD